MSLARRAFSVATRTVIGQHTVASSSSTLCLRATPSLSFLSSSSASASSSPSIIRRFTSTPAAANASLDIPSPDGVERPNDKVNKIVDDIMKLNIFESIQLSKALQKSMGLEGVSIGMGGGGGGGGGSSAPAPAAAAAPVVAAKPVEVQTAFAVRLDSFDAASKIKVIKEVRAATGLGLKESKDMVEGAPKVVKKDLSKADADALVAKLKEAGAKCTLE